MPYLPCSVLFQRVNHHVWIQLSILSEPITRLFSTAGKESQDYTDRRRWKCVSYLPISISTDTPASALIFSSSFSYNEKHLSAYQGQFLPPWPDPIPAYLLRDLRSLRVFLLPSIFHLPISTRPFPSALLPIASHALPLQLLWHKPPLSILFSLNQSFNRLNITTMVYQIPVTQTEICLMELTA